METIATRAPRAWIEALDVRLYRRSLDSTRIVAQNACEQSRLRGALIAWGVMITRHLTMGAYTCNRISYSVLKSGVLSIIIWSFIHAHDNLNVVCCPGPNKQYMLPTQREERISKYRSLRSRLDRYWNYNKQVHLYRDTTSLKRNILSDNILVAKVWNVNNKLVIIMHQLLNTLRKNTLGFIIQKLQTMCFCLG